MASALVSPACDPPIMVRDRRRKGFFTLDNALLDRYGDQLGPYGLAVYVALARFANQDSACWPSLSTIARKTRMSRPQVIREVAKLKHLRLIAVEHQVNKQGEYSSNIYTLLDISPSPAEQAVVSASNQGSLSQTPPLVSAGDHRSLTQRPKQHPGKNTQYQNKTQRTPSTPLTNNNNSGAHPEQPPDVVVAFAPTLRQAPLVEIPPTTQQEELALDQPPSSGKADPTPLDPPAPGQAGASALIAVGIAPTVAQRLAQRFSRERIAEKLRYLDFLQAEQPDKVQNPCGWLRRAIEEDYARPDGYRLAAEVAAEAAAFGQAEAERQRLLQEQQQAQEAAQERQQAEAAARLTHWQTTYGTSQQELALWAQLVDEFRLSMPAASFKLYLVDTVLLSLRDDQAVIGLPNPAAREWLENRFIKKIERALASSLSGRKITVRFVDLGTER